MGHIFSIPCNNVMSEACDLVWLQKQVLVEKILTPGAFNGGHQHALAFDLWKVHLIIRLRRQNKKNLLNFSWFAHHYGEPGEQQSLAKHKTKSLHWKSKPIFVSGPIFRVVHQSIAKRHDFEHFNFYKFSKHLSLPTLVPEVFSLSEARTSGDLWDPGNQYQTF